MEIRDYEPTQPNSWAFSPKCSAMLLGHDSQPVKPSVFIRFSSWSWASSSDIVLVVAYSDSWVQTKECTGDIRPLLPLVTLSWFLDSYIFSAIHNYLLNERNSKHRWLSSPFVERFLPSLKSLSSSVMWNPCESWLRPWLTRCLHHCKNTDVPVPSKNRIMVILPQLSEKHIFPFSQQWRLYTYIPWHLFPQDPDLPMFLLNLPLPTPLPNDCSTHFQGPRYTFRPLKCPCQAQGISKISTKGRKQYLLGMWLWWWELW